MGAGATSFYATIAQVIPLLFIVLLVEMRVLDAEDEKERFGEALGLISLFVAECVALGAIYTERDTPLIFNIVVLGAGFGAVTIVLEALSPIAISSTRFAQDRIPGAARLGSRVLLRVLVYGFAFVMYWLLVVLFR